MPKSEPPTPKGILKPNGVSESNIKSKIFAGLHEADHNKGTDNMDHQPLDMQVLKFILESMGADKYEPRVVNQLQEFIHRYVTEILVDAQEYSSYAQKKEIDADDIRLAISSRLNHNYAQLPSRELLMELAHKRNSIPLPPISNEYGVRLPPAQHQLVTLETLRQDQKNGTRNHLSNTGSRNQGASSNPAQGNRNKKIASQQIKINFQKKP